MTTPDEFVTKRDAFHAHLDVCRQCRENPMALCPIGRGRLVDAIAEGRAK